MRCSQDDQGQTPLGVKVAGFLNFLLQLTCLGPVVLLLSFHVRLKCSQVSTFVFRQRWFDRKIRRICEEKMKSNRILPMSKLGSRHRRKTRKSNKLGKVGDQESGIDCKKDLGLEDAGGQKVGIHRTKRGLLGMAKSLEMLVNFERAERKLRGNRASLSDSHISVETSVNNRMDLNSVSKNFKRISKSALFSDIMKEERERENPI